MSLVPGIGVLCSVPYSGSQAVRRNSGAPLRAGPVRTSKGLLPLPHTPDDLLAVAKAFLETRGHGVTVNRPFAGALVPAAHSGEDRRVHAVMVEVNRGLYSRSTPHGWAQHFMAEVHAQRRQALAHLTLAPR